MVLMDGCLLPGDGGCLDGWVDGAGQATGRGGDRKSSSSSKKQQEATGEEEEEGEGLWIVKVRRGREAALASLRHPMRGRPAVHEGGREGGACHA